MSDAHRDELLDDLAEWLRRHPDAWPPSEEFTISDTRADEIINSVLVGQRPTPTKARTRRRRRRIVGGVCFVVAATSGAVVAASMLRSEQPTQPQAGAACRAEPHVRADAIVIAPGVDPLEGCRALWIDGGFDGLGRDDPTTAVVPVLSACIGGGGAIEVFPGEQSVCADLGLAVADPTLSPENQAIVDLQDRLVEDINLPDCIPVSEAATLAAAILDESPLTGWDVTISPGADNGTCGKVAVDATDTRIIVNHLDLPD